MKISFYILSILLFISCQQTETVDLSGHWAITYEDGRKAEIYDWQEMLIKNSRIELVDGAGFAMDGIYKMEKDSIAFYFGNGEQFKSPFKQVAKDTIEMFENRKFCFISDTTYYHSLFGMNLYELAGWRTKDRVNSDFRYCPIHLILNKKGDMQVMFEGRIIQDLQNLPRYSIPISTNEKRRFVPLIFIGKGIKLVDLHEIYLNIFGWFSSNRADLVFSKNQKDGYNVFYDKIEIWQEEIDEFRQDKIMPPIPPPPMKSYKKYYLENNYQPILFRSGDDLKTIEKLNPNGKYIISINQNISIKSYAVLKDLLRKLRATKNIKYRTEITE